MRHPVLYGHHGGQRHGAGDCHRHRRQYWFGQLAGRVTEQGERAERVPERDWPRPSMLLIRFMMGDDADCAADQRLHQRRLVGSRAVCALRGGWLNAGNAADDCHLHLARGAVKLSKQKVIVKHLDAIQNFGAMDILCTDKTGTLTQDKIVLRTTPTSPVKPANACCTAPAEQPLPDRAEKSARCCGAGRGG